MADICIVDARASEEIIYNLEKIGLKVVKTIACRELDQAVSYHPDMVIFQVSKSEIIVAPNVYEYYREELKAYDIKVNKGLKSLEKDYPNNIAYNVGRLGQTLVHNKKFTDRSIIDYAYAMGLDIIHVKQGYSKCSLGIINQNMGITSDVLIYKELRDIGKEVLLIRPGNILLKGYNYGFIGGCMGLYQNKILFSGSIKSHPDFEKIRDFIKKTNKEVIELSRGELIDLGTIFCF